MRRAALLLGLASAVACGDDWAHQPPDGVQPAAPDARPPIADRVLPLDGEVPFSLPPGSAGDPRLGVVLSAGQVRAGRVTSADQLLHGIKSTARVGDFKIYNSRVAFIIADERVPSGYVPYGGKLLDAARAGTTSQSLLGEIAMGVAIHLLKPTSVGVVSDGSDGNPALVRVIGEPAPFSLLDALLGGLAPQPVRLVLDYVLPADSDVLEMRWRVFNRTYAPQELPLLPVGVTAGDGAQFFAEDVGFGISNATALDYLAMVSPGRQLTPLVFYQGIVIMAGPSAKLAPAGESQQIYKFLVTDGEPEAVRRSIRPLRGDAEQLALTGLVRSGPGPLGGVRVHAERDETERRYVSMTRSDASGSYRLALGPGSYRITAVADGRTVPAPVLLQIGSAPATADVQLAAGSQLQVTSTASDGSGPLPVKLTIKPKTPPAGFPESFGEPFWPHGSLIRFAPSGKETVGLAAGSYTVTASRGFEYELAQSTVTLADGEAKSVDLQLTRSVSTPGFMCGDFHVHAMWSPDSDDLYPFKVAALAGEGLEIPVITEHEYIGDINPTINSMGLQPWLRGVVGEELTTFVYGHFNPFPLTPLPDRPNQGAVVWFGKSPSEVFAETHATWPGSVLQVNHPRSTAMGFGYFDHIGYDAKLGTSKRASEWSQHFEAVEVFNGSGWDANQDSTVQDWYSFLDRGFLVTATGNSDSHRADWDLVGYPRNYVKLSTDVPANLNPTELAQSVREGRVLVSGGPFVTVSVGGMSLGEVADATSKKVTVSVSVQAPTWVPVDKLRVIVGGQTALEQSIDASTQDPKNPALRFQKDLTVLVDHDSWLIVVVTGTGTLDPVCPGHQPFAVTNPVYLDVNGNGVYDPPKSF